VKDTIELLRKLYRIRSCNRNLPRDIGLERPCLYYHIGQCTAPCQGKVTKEEYRRSIDEALEFLNGNQAPVLAMLQSKMEEASENMDFEKAIEYRDLIQSVSRVSERQKITHGDGEDKDVLAMAVDGVDAVMQVFFIRGGKMIGREHFYLRVAPHDTKAAILSSFVKQYYAGTPFVPKELMLETDIEDHEVVEAWLGEKRGQRVYLHVPKKGTKEKLVEMAAENAAIVLRQDRERIKREEGRTIGAVHEIEKLLGIDHAMRMEAFDISNISGFESVGSMIVYEKGKPKRSDYRKFKIRTVQGPDDYASMEEVLTRRFAHGLEERKELDEKGMEYEMGSFSRFPDLILMDGGRGQVNIALRVLDTLGISIPVCGMVKDDYHRTRGIYFNNVELPIDTHSEAFRLVTRIQDEAHRFAIEYHRSLRSKQQVHSILDDIDGIGPARRKALMRTFKSLEAVRDATLEQLANAPSMNAKSAQQVYDFFHAKQGADTVDVTEV
jgi:excinuclease ABC subunit C